ncbi:MAG: hypothetical protein RLZZ419_1680 [Pseudomonadota bacterium]|jgi:peptidoglycan/LPS O-acetylase OafA/YrhL
MLPETRMHEAIATQTINHNNNFNLLRTVAATAVLFSHSYTLTGNNNSEPLTQLTGFTFGELAVDIFFVMSGYLVTASLLRIPNIKVYFIARVMRIYPALIISSVFCVFIVGLGFTHLELKNFLINPKTYTYLMHDSTIIFGTQYNLPEVFEANPYPEAVNGSLWTLRFKLMMYVLLGMLAWCYLRKSPHNINNITVGFRRIIAVVATLSMAVHLAINLIPGLQETFSTRLANLIPRFPGLAGEIKKLFHFSAIFFYGAVLCCFQSYLAFRKIHALLLAFLFLLIFVNHDAFFVSYNLVIGYLIISLAFLPSGIIKKFNAVGDYSYGIYMHFQFNNQSWQACLIWYLWSYSRFLFRLLWPLPPFLGMGSKNRSSV